MLWLVIISLVVAMVGIEAFGQKWLLCHQYVCFPSMQLDSQLVHLGDLCSAVRAYSTQETGLPMIRPMWLANTLAKPLKEGHKTYSIWNRGDVGSSWR